MELHKLIMIVAGSSELKFLEINSHNPQLSRFYLQADYRNQFNVLLEPFRAIIPQN